MLSRKKTSITGTRVAKFSSTNMKPSKARKIIRRYHVLINKRKTICDELGITLSNKDECKNTAIISEQLNAHDRAQFTKGFSNADSPQAPEPSSNGAHAPTRDHALQNLGHIMNEIANGGGLANYQMASRNGQASDRGGDSSKRLVQWLKELGLQKGPRNVAASALEIGSLSCNNAISTSGLFDPVVRIDLSNANDTRGITKQDFMERPLPSEAAKFGLISCSLVLNFVPTPHERGLMIERFPHFLRNDGYLFIVLPLPCLENSRYMSQNHFITIMSSRGFALVRTHGSHKLSYFLFKLRQDTPGPKRQKFAKVKIQDGPNMNNFCIVI